jgi:hypothetical protein
MGSGRSVRSRSIPLRAPALKLKCGDFHRQPPLRALAGLAELGTSILEAFPEELAVCTPKFCASRAPRRAESVPCGKVDAHRLCEPSRERRERGARREHRRVGRWRAGSARRRGHVALDLADLRGPDDRRKAQCLQRLRGGPAQGPSVAATNRCWLALCEVRAASGVRLGTGRHCSVGERLATTRALPWPLKQLQQQAARCKLRRGCQWAIGGQTHGCSRYVNFESR